MNARFGYSSIRGILASVLLSTLVIQTARANWTLYDNGAVTLTTNAYSISGPLAVTNSFVLSGNSTITLFNGIGLVCAEGTTPVSFNWSIGTTSFGTDVTFANGLTPFLSFVGNTGGFDVYSASFDTGDINLSAGTYWLTLSGAVNSNNIHEIYWAQSGGPSSAFQRENLNPASPVPSESFTVVGVPEPSTTALMVLALIALGFVMRRRQRA